MAGRPAQARALRALAEGAAPTLALLADAAQRSLPALERQAERDGWRLRRVGQEEDIGERLRASVAGLMNKVEAMAVAAGQGEKIDKAEIDALVAMIRGLEKIGEIMRPEAAAKENQIRQDEDLAAALQSVNDRIVDLARELAAGLVTGECGLCGGGQGAP